MLTREAARAAMERALSGERRAHSLSVAETAAEMARAAGVPEEEAYVAGLVHDITKGLSDPEQLQYCRENGILLEECDRRAPAVLHALTGAREAGRLGAPPGIVSAVRWHTTGKAAMTPLEKIIYLADVIEPLRPGHIRLPALEAYRSGGLDAGVLASLGGTVRYLRKKAAFIHPATLEAFEYLRLENTFNAME